MRKNRKIPSARIEEGNENYVENFAAIAELLRCVQLLRLHGLLPARLLCPWDFLGKNTGVSCHFLLQGVSLTQGWNPRFLWLLVSRFSTTEPPGNPSQGWGEAKHSINSFILHLTLHLIFHAQDNPCDWERSKSINTTDSLLTPLNILTSYKTSECRIFSSHSLCSFILKKVAAEMHVVWNTTAVD